MPRRQVLATIRLAALAFATSAAAAAFAQTPLRVGFVTTLSGPQGVLGGRDGAVNEVTVFRDGEAHVPPHLSKEQDIPLKAGDRVRVGTPGGGGYGDPRQRDPDLVRRDVELGYYTSEQAREMFGFDEWTARVPPDPSAVA